MRINPLMNSLVFIAAMTSAATAQIAEDETPFIPHELLVMLDAEVDPSKVLSELELLAEFEVIGVPSPSAHIYHLHVSGEQWMHALARFQAHRHVRAVQLNHVIEHRETVPNDPNFGQQWHHVQSGDHDIDSDLAWDITTGGTAGNGARVVVAVLEGGGANYNHVDLIDNHWVNSAEIADNGIDDDNNGYVDDYNGWNSGNNTDNIAGGGHGTSVSGMIGATGDNGVGGVGVNWDVDIMQVDMANGLTESNVIAAYEYPKTMRDIFNATNGAAGAFVVATNASWGIDQANPANYPIWCAFYDELGASGILNCGATTNSALNVDVVGDMPTACGSDYMVSVTATNSNDVRTFSGYGVNSIDLGAPGDQVYLPSGTSGYGNTSGTSFASPCVAGAIGLVYSVPCPDLAELSIANPQGAADLVLGYIYQGVDLVPNLLTEVATGGRLNVANSVNLALEGCGPIECSIDGFAATPECVYDMASDTILTIAMLEVEFSNFLCSAEILCYRASSSSSWTCALTEGTELQLSNGNPVFLEGLLPATEYEVYFVTDTLTSDTLQFTTPDCGALIPGCMDANALNYNPEATIDSGNCEYPCSEVVFTVITDCWPEEVGWVITDSEGNALAEVATGTYTVEGTAEVWSGCLVNGCHVLTLTDSYGDGMYGSQWPGCEIDGYYQLETPEGVIIVAMTDPDFGDEISHPFCLPIVPGCTEATACNFNPEANANDGSCYAPGDACDDGDESTVLDVYTSNCACVGVPAVPGCNDAAACNFAPEANVNDGSCYYVAQGAISGAQSATDQTVESYTYDGPVEHEYAWTASGGVIQGEAAGVGVLSVDVLWQSTGGGWVAVSETDTTGCSGTAQLNVNLLVNGVAEWDLTGVELYPNPAQGWVTLTSKESLEPFVRVEVVNELGQSVLTWSNVASPLVFDTGELTPGWYSVRLLQIGFEQVTIPFLIVR